MPVMTRILRHLLDEGISIRDLRTILDGLLAVDGVTTADVVETIVFSPNTGIKFPSVDSRPVHELRPEELAECARTVLKRYISHKYTRGGNTLVVYLVEPGIEKMVRASTGPLAQADCDRIIDAVQREVGTSMPSYQMPVILTTMDVRRKLRLLIEAEFPELAVLSYQELSPDMNIQPIARISFED
jgi:type III secretory pathway component EscV